MAAPPLDSPCDRPVNYPEDSKTLVKSSKGRSRTLIQEAIKYTNAVTNRNVGLTLAKSVATINTLWSGDADLRLYVTTVQDG